MKKIVDAFENLKQLPFPEHPVSDELDDWMLDMAEMDGHLAGLASASIAGKHPDLRSPDGFEALEQRLRQVKILDADRDKFQQCRAYMNALGTLRLALIEALAK